VKKPRTAHYYVIYTAIPLLSEHFTRHTCSALLGLQNLTHTTAHHYDDDGLLEDEEQ
jgi:hypothetical protein